MRTSIRVAFPIFIVLSLIGLAVAGCAQPGPTVTPSPTPTAGTPTTTPGKVYKLKYAEQRGPALAEWPYKFAAFAKEATRRAAGRMVIDLYPDQSLVATQGMLDALRTGVCDIAAVSMSYYPGYFDMDEVCQLPIAVETSEQVVMLYLAMYDEFFKPARDKIGIRQLSTVFGSPYWVFTRNKPINKPEDFKGVSFRIGVQPLRDILLSLGAIPVTGTTVETYEMLQKGVVDGTVSSGSGPWTYRWYEVGKPGYLIDVGGLCQGLSTTSISTKVYESLPADLQQILNDCANEFLTTIGFQVYGVQDINGLEQCAAKGNQLIIWSNAEKERFRKDYKEALATKWAKTMDAKGYPATKAVARMNELIPQIVQKYPKLTLEQLLKKTPQLQALVAK